MPAFSVRHTPPDATATNQRFLSVGSTAMSAMRPLVTAGPMPRSVRPDQPSADHGTLGLSSSFLSFSSLASLSAGLGGFVAFLTSSFVFWASGLASWNAAVRDAANDNASATGIQFFTFAPWDEDSTPILLKPRTQRNSTAPALAVHSRAHGPTR